MIGVTNAQALNNKNRGGNILNGQLTYGKAIGEDILPMSFVQFDTEINQIMDEPLTVSDDIYRYTLLFSNHTNRIIEVYASNKSVAKNIYSFYLTIVNEDNTITPCVAKVSLTKGDTYNFLYQGNKLFYNYMNSYLPITDTGFGTAVNMSNADIISGTVLNDDFYDDYFFSYTTSRTTETWYRYKINDTSYEAAGTVTDISNTDSYTYFRCAYKDSFARITYTDYTSIDAGHKLIQIDWYDFSDNTLVNQHVYLTIEAAIYKVIMLNSTTVIALAVDNNTDNGAYVYVIDKNMGVYQIDTTVYTSESSMNINKLSDSAFAVYGTSSYGITCIFAKSGNSYSMVHQNYEGSYYGGVAYTSNNKLVQGGTNNYQLVLNNYELNIGYKLSTSTIEGVNVDKLTSTTAGRVYTL